MALSAFATGMTEFAWAQKPANIAKEDNGIVQYVVAALIILVISITGFLKAHRSHKA